MKTIIAMILMVSSFAVYANYRCYVDLVDRYSNYRYDTFDGYTDPRGMCREALRECNREKAQRGLSQTAECVTRGSTGPGPGPGPGPGTYRRFLNFSDYQIASEALYGNIGSCRVNQGGWGSACNYYVKVNGYGYPDVNGTGCADRNYTARYGCNSYDEFTNAGCLIRIAIERNACR